MSLGCGGRMARGAVWWQCAAMCIALFPALVTAQADRDRDALGRESRITLGWSGNAPREFNPQRCGSPVGMTLGAGFAREVLPHFWLGGRGDLMYANPFKKVNCFFRDSAAIPGGPFSTTREEVTNRVPQYQFLQLAATVALEPVRLNALRVRAFGGAGALLLKPVFPLFYGVELLPGIGRGRYALSAERWNVRLGYDSVTYSYTNGVLRNRVATGFHKSRSSLVVRLSVVTGLGGRGRG